MSYLKKFFVGEISFLKARQGSVAILAAAAMFTTMIGVSVAVNVGTIINTKTRLQSIADAAALKAAKAANESLASGGSNAASNAQAVAETVAQATVNANAAGAGLSDIPTAIVAYSSNGYYSSTVTVGLSSEPKFILANLLPAMSGSVSVSSTASVTAGQSYVQIIFLVDVSNSMTVGGTQEVINTLLNTPAQCAFACHDTHGYYDSIKSIRCTTQTGSSQSLPACNMRAYAQSNGLDLKIDYVRSALANLASQISDLSENASNHFLISMITFGTQIQQTLAPTSDQSSISSALSSVDAEDATPYINSHNSMSGMYGSQMDVYNGGYTKTADALNYVASHLTNVGDGSSADKMTTYVVFLSDGTSDTYINNNALASRNVTTDFGSGCTTLKSMNAKVFSIWTPYYVDRSSAWFNQYLGSFPDSGAGSMEAAVQDCATSDDYYFKASDGDEIKQAFSSVFNKIVTDTSLRLTK
ncbi:MAG: vWA domain-containing protein [Acetobacter sp.]|uniref:pilus assembly protein TadG-related protein n=1 Tax=Acetobacter sp. TaxID=440 RepID=UPI0039E7B0FE